MGPALNTCVGLHGPMKMEPCTKIFLHVTHKVTSKDLIGSKSILL